MSEPLKVLLLEDSEDDALLMERALRSGGLAPRTHRVQSREELAAALKDAWDVVLADYTLPSFDAMEALRMVRERQDDVPFLVVTGSIGEERAARILRSGASDFLLKDRLDRLAPAVRRELRDRQARQEREAAQAELERARARYEALIQSASDVIYVVDADGRIRFSSPSTRELLGLGPDEVEGEDAFRFVHPDDRERVRRELAAIVAGEQRRAEYRVLRSDGEVRHVESVGTNLTELDAVGGIVVNTRDLTERKTLEEQLFQSQKMEAIGRLAGGIAHDFNNLLTVITGNTRILLERLGEDGPGHEDTLQILGAAERAAALTRQLLAFSRHQILAPRIVDVSRVARGVQEMLQRLMGEDVALAMVTPEEGPFARVDPVQLEQILMNLAVNAREAMPRGGAVTVVVRSVEGHELPVDLPEGGHERWVRVVFRDSGPGIPPDTLDHIFEPFFTTKEQGTGLGLATVYGIVRQSGGHIRVACPPGGGTVFTMELPEVDEAEERPAQDRDEDHPVEECGGDEAILLVEDSPDVRRVVRRILTRDGFRVTSATSGEEALEKVRGNGNLDLLITDLVMPGMPGARLAREVRSHHPELPVLYMSGYSGDQVLTSDEIARHGAFIQKPFTPEELSRAVRRLLDSGGP